MLTLITLVLLAVLGTAGQSCHMIHSQKVQAFCIVSLLKTYTYCKKPAYTGLAVCCFADSQMYMLLDMAILADIRHDAMTVHRLLKLTLLHRFISLLV